MVLFEVIVWDPVDCIRSLSMESLQSFLLGGLERILIAGVSLLSPALQRGQAQLLHHVASLRNLWCWKQLPKGILLYRDLEPESSSGYPYSRILLLGPYILFILFGNQKPTIWVTGLLG